MILHITKREAFEKTKINGVYTDVSLKSDGFIHCSNPEQIIKVANFLFKGEKDLVLLLIDEKKVKSKIKYEDLYRAGENYPHIYGPLNLDAIIDVVDFKAKEDGLFKLPEQIKEL